MSINTSWQRACAALFACALASCGGGGGGSDGAGALQVTASASSMTLVGLLPQVGTGPAVTFTLTGGKGPYYIAAKVSGAAVTPMLYILDDNRVQYGLQSVADPSQPLREQGTYTFAVCSDDQCAHIVWQHDYPYTYTQFQVDMSPVSLTGTEGTAGTPHVIAVTPPDTDHVIAPASSPSWLAVAHDDAGNLVVTPSGVGLAAGSISDQVTLQAGQETYTISIPVTLTLADGLVAPALADLVQRRDSTSATLTGQAPVTFAGGADRAWTATSDSPWLVVDTRSGTGAGPMSYHVDLSKVPGAIRNFDQGVATITLQASGLTNAVSTLHLSRQLPEVSTVTPSQVEPGQAATVTVVGRGLSQLTSATQIQVGGQAASGGAILSDTRAVIQVAGQAAGSKLVAVPNAAQQFALRAGLAVTSAPMKAATVLAPTSDSPSSMVYDPSRHAVFVSNHYGNVLQRYKLASDGTWVLTGVPMANAWRVQMSTDRRTLYLLTGDALYEFDPDTLAMRGFHPAPGGGGLDSGYSFGQPMPLTSDQRLWLTDNSGGYFDLLTNEWRGAYDEFGAAGADDPSPTPDGTHLYTVGTYYGGGGWWSADTHSTQILPASVPANAHRASFDLQGDLALFDGFQLMRTSDWSLLGTLQMDAGETGLPNAQVSPDGTRAYVLGGYDYWANADRVEVFDLTQLQPGTSSFVHLGTLPIATSATACQGQYECDVGGHLAIDPVGKTLFWVGGHAFVVIPIPSAMSGLSAVQGAARPQAVHAPSRLRLAAPATKQSTAH